MVHEGNVVNVHRQHMLNDTLVVSWSPNTLDTGYMTVHWRLGFLPHFITLCSQIEKDKDYSSSF